MTNHVNRLEAAGLVGRASDRTDARAWKIDLTPHGHERLAEMRSTMGTNVEPYIAQLNTDDRAALARGLEVMRDLMTLSVPASTD